MANVVVKMRIMPKGTETDLDKVSEDCKKKIEAFGGKFYKTEIEPVAFGLKMLYIIFLMPEEKGALDPLEEQLKTVEGVSRAEAVDVRRAIG